MAKPCRQPPRTYQPEVSLPLPRAAFPAGTFCFLVPHRDAHKTRNQTPHITPSKIPAGRPVGAQPRQEMLPVIQGCSTGQGEPGSPLSGYHKAQMLRAALQAPHYPHSHALRGSAVGLPAPCWDALPAPSPNTRPRTTPSPAPTAPEGARHSSQHTSSGFRMPGKGPDPHHHRSTPHEPTRVHGPHPLTVPAGPSARPSSTAGPVPARLCRAGPRGSPPRCGTGTPGAFCAPSVAPPAPTSFLTVRSSRCRVSASVGRRGRAPLMSAAPLMLSLIHI